MFLSFNTGRTIGYIRKGVGRGFFELIVVKHAVIDIIKHSSIKKNSSKLSGNLKYAAIRISIRR